MDESKQTRKSILSSIQVVNNGHVQVSEYAYICEISSSHGGEYDVQSCLLGCTAM
jgi:hypothetical protein